MLFDTTTGFCQAAPMYRHVKKLIAVILAIWLPLFGGNALAMAVSVPGGGAAHDPAHASPPHHPVAVMDHCVAHDGSAGGHTQSDTGCKHSAACQLAVAAGQIEIALLVLSEHVTPRTTLFQSQTVAPLDTPPPARA